MPRPAPQPALSAVLEWLAYERQDRALAATVDPDACDRLLSEADQISRTISTLNALEADSRHG